MSDYEMECEEYNQEENYEDNWQYDMDYGLQSKTSKENNYNVYSQDKLIQKIYTENLQSCILTCIEPEWNLMLLSFCNFNQEEFNNVIDQEQTGRKMIRYQEGYKPNETIGQCPICCLETILISNPCNHSFCLTCWVELLSVNHTDRNLYELFPMCPLEDCFHRTNLLLMKRVWLDFPKLQQQFQNLLCSKFAQKSDKVRLCQRCNNAILINLAVDAELICDCGNRICKFCGEEQHFPLICSDLKAWSQLVSKKENQWLNQLVTQQCPMCKTSIDKNGGCIHMTCKCKYEFCWICLKVWKGHNNYSACNNISRDDHEKRLKDEQQKKKQNQQEYSVRFQEAKSEVERMEHIMKRVKNQKMNQYIIKFNDHQILTKDTSKLVQLRLLLLNALFLCRNSAIYSFFQLQGFRLLSLRCQNLTNLANSLDDYLVRKLNLIENTRKQFETNEKEIAMSTGSEYLNVIRQKFFQGREYFLKEEKQIKFALDDIRKGQFMEIKM